MKPTAEDGSITVASANESKVVLALGNIAVLLHLIQKSPSSEEVSRTTLPHEVACINVSGVESDPSVMDTSDSEATVVAIGTWTDFTVRVMQLPAFTETDKVTFTEDNEVIARSLLFATMGGAQHLLVGLGNGTLFTFSLTTERTLASKRSVSLGTQPIALSTFT